MATRETAEAFFDAKDVDGTGTLSLGELGDVLKGQGYSRKQVKDIFSQADLDNDKQIDKEEFLTYMGICPPEVHSQAAKKRFFLQFDKDADGRMNVEELQASMAESGFDWSEEQAADVLKEMDTDGSGYVSCHEFITRIYGDQDED